MAIDAKGVLVGTPDQKTTGSIMSAPVGTPLPEDIDDDLDAAFIAGDSGYVSSDGLTLTPDISTSDINDWSGALVRRVLETWNNTIAWTYIQTTLAELRNAFGANNVEVTAEADATHGQRVKVSIGSTLPERRSWIFRMKDGAARVMIVVPDAQVTSMDDISFTTTDPISWPITLSCYPDASGNAVYILIDDGRTIAVPGAKPVQSVDLTPETASVTVDGTVDLTVAVTPADATDAAFTAASSDTSKATVAVNGTKVTVTGKAATDAGKPVTITVTTEDGGKTATSQVTVNPKA